MRAITFEKTQMARSFIKGMRFADSKRWTIDVNDYGEIYYDVYLVHKTTPKTIQVFTGTLFRGDPRVEGATLLEDICKAYQTKKPMLNTVTEPHRFHIKHGSDGPYFVVGKGTAARRVHLAHAIVF